MRISSNARTMATSARVTCGRSPIRAVGSMSRLKRANVSRARAASRRQSMRQRVRGRDVADQQIFQYRQRGHQAQGADARRPVPALAPTAGGTGRPTSSPCISSSAPGSGSWNPARIFITVDLPEPFWPSRPCTSPGMTSSATLLSTSEEPKRLDSRRIEIAGASPGWLRIRLSGHSMPHSLAKPAICLSPYPWSKLAGMPASLALLASKI